jgi:stage II sporulation protein R
MKMKGRIAMRKIIVFLLIIIGIFLVKSFSFSEAIIPDEAIRLRVLANSNSKYDQNIKNLVKDNLQNTMYETLKDTENINEARNVIKKNLNNYDQVIASTLASAQYDKGYDIDFGSHYFPEKTYKGIKYDEGYYESVLVTLGEGEGDNWWCVLFPPLCLLEAEESNEVEYKFFVQELIEKFF